MNMLDVILTVSDKTSTKWVNQARRSIQTAIAASSYPVNLIESPAVPGHIGQALINGFGLSTAPYVTWVDDDDFVLPDAFECLKKHFDAKPSAIFAREIRLWANNDLELFQGRHHLTAWQRETIVAALPGFADLPGAPYRALFAAAGDCGVDEMSWVYVHRKYRSQGMGLRAKVFARERGRQ